MHKLSTQDRVQILNALSEGMGVNAVSRVTNKSKNTILKLLADVGEACALHQDRVMRNLSCKRVECYGWQIQGNISLPRTPITVPKASWFGANCACC